MIGNFEKKITSIVLFFFKLYAFILLTSTLVLLTSTLVPGINYFVVTTHPLHQLQVRKRSSSSCYMIETYNTRHRFPFIVCYRYYTNKTIFLI